MTGLSFRRLTQITLGERLRQGAWSNSVVGSKRGDGAGLGDGGSSGVKCADLRDK